MKKSAIIYIHVLFWMILLGGKFVPLIVTKFLSPFEYAKITIYLSTLQPVFFYIGYFVIMRIKWKRNILTISALGILFSYLTLYLISTKVFAFAIAPISSFLFWMLIGCLFRLFIDWFHKKEKIVILEKENLASNLALLKSQVNPHFLFNTLHNIDAMIFGNPDKASNSLVMLADIMRYMLNDAKSDLVALENELEHLQNYLSLEQIRLKNQEFINFEIVGNPRGIKIAPMLMIPFVENAFKHAVDATIKNGITIKIVIENQKLSFTCQNFFDNSESIEDKEHGIGLNTVKNRLDLIYKNRHNLSIKSDNSVFFVNLEIDLNEN